ncbi:hypothetical protein CRENBAI_011942 [Crenichthys baileyi]|uniref:Uncharacterized protein n=1 Tax=Crenichthys baileyi TaxID=28760 RepID=A0AAV9RDJ4_9TELE
MEDSPPRHVQSLLTGCSNQRQVRTSPRPIISQGVTFIDLLHGRHHSFAELRPSFTPSPPQAPNSFHAKAYATTRIGSRGGRLPRVTRTPPFSPVEGSGVIIVVIILCLLLLASLGSVLYFLHKKGKIPCGRSGKQEITKERPTTDDIVVEMKNNPKNEDAVLLKAVNGEKKGPNDQ